MPWAECDELKRVLEKLGIAPKLSDCHDCGAKPGEIHSENCDVQRCSACGGQRLQCDCKAHDPAFSRWTGFWPGQLDCIALGMMAVWEGGGRSTPVTPSLI